MQYASDIIKYVKNKLNFLNNKKKIIEQEDFINKNVCIICTMQFKDNDDIVVLNKEYDIKCECNYAYHRECIDRWFDHSQTCPLCRSIAYYPKKSFYSEHKIIVYTFFLLLYILLHYFLGDVYYMQEDTFDFFFP